MPETTGIWGMLDQLDQSINKLDAIEEQVGRRAIVPTTRAVTYAPRRATLGSPNDWWETLKSWVTVGIPGWIGPLAGLYQQLVEAGVITPAQAAQGLSKEELIALIKGILEEEKPWYEQPWVPWMVCAITTTGLVTGAVAFYVAKKKR